MDKKSDFVPRQPDYYVSAMVRSTEHKGRIGAAWRKDDGAITIRLNPFVVLDATDDIIITLFPRDERRDERSDQIASDVPF